MSDMQTMTSCHLCPKQCGVNRDVQTGVCGCGSTMRIARAALHMWEEPCISGERGSGALFFSGCPLHCIFCQNSAISHGNAGREYSVRDVADAMLRLQSEGAANINLVTAGQWATGVHEAIGTARADGLRIPIVWNSGGYETERTLDLLRDDIDIYLPDLKYLSPELSKRYSHAEDYPEVAKRALRKMTEAAGNPEFDDDGYMKRGVIVRHLVLPGHRDESERVIAYLHETYGDRIYISIMNQYTPPKTELPYKNLNRKLTRYEYDKVVAFAESISVEQAYIQIGATAKESFIPEFDV